jgi:hypothetical protein
MLTSLKKLITRSSPDTPWGDVRRWAREQKMTFSHLEDSQGFWVEDSSQTKPWRLEWGPSQRAYIDGTELRMRMDMGVPGELQMLALSKTLFETLEHRAFESFTETTQTLIDHNTPEEMRWLVMFSTASYQASRDVLARMQLIGSSPLEAAYWMEGDLANHIERALSTLLLADPPFMLMVLRSRVYLRMQLKEPQVEIISQAVTLFETAVLKALQTASLAQQEGTQWQQSSTATAWQTQPGYAQDFVRTEPGDVKN